MRPSNSLFFGFLLFLVVCSYSGVCVANDNDVLVGNTDGISEEKPPENLRSGRVTNDSNGEIYIYTTSRAGSEATWEVMPGQNIDIPADTVEVRAELVDDSFGDVSISVEVMMPDGSTHAINSLPATVRIT